MKGWESELKAVDAIISEPLSRPRGHPHYIPVLEGHDEQ